MTALLILGIVALVLTVTFGVLITVLVSQSLSRAFLALDRMHLRNAKHLDSVLNRLMAIRWEDYAALASITEEAEDGAFLSPEDQMDDDEKPTPTNWGHLSRLRERISLTSEEAELLDEDFEPSGDVRRTAP